MSNFTRTVGPQLKRREPLPPEIVSEFLGGISFSRNSERDVQIAEDIASNVYNDLDDLINTCHGMIEQTPKKEKDFQAHVKAVKKSPFYQKYL